jgi:phage terminase large subunit-like protein
MAADARSDTGDRGALDLMSILVLEDGRLWGEAATDFQWADASANLDEFTEQPYAVQTRPRGGSKTADQAGCLICVMVVQAPAGSRLYALAADRDQGALIIDSIRGYVERTPALRGLLEISAYRVTVLGTGVRLDVLAADGPGAWGLRPYYIVIDEIAQWADTPSSRSLYEAIRTSVGKVNGRMVITTTAGDPTHFSYAIREHAIADPLWRVHEVPGPVPWVDLDRLEEQRRALSDSSYRRLHLNEWTDAEDRLTTLEDLRACATLDGDLPARPGVEYVIGVDLGITHDRTAVAICHSEDVIGGTPDRGRKIVVDRIQVWQGSPEEAVVIRDVYEAVLAASHEYNFAKVVIDPHQAVGLAQDLRRRGVRVEEFYFTTTSNGRLATTLHLLLRNRTIVLPKDPGLIDELSRVRLRESSPNVLRLDHDAGQHDDRAIAISLAGQDLLEHHHEDGPRARWLSGPSRRPRRLGGERW